MKPTGNTILITGGTSGIGLGLAQRFASAGNAVIITGRRKELLDRISAEHPGIEAHRARRHRPRCHRRRQRQSRRGTPSS